jgi:DNA-binding winged helix-turn-helix (wHTH) protein
LGLEPVRISEAIRFGEGFELDRESYTLRHAGRVLKLERIPMDILLFLVEQRGQLVSRQQIVDRVWGEKVFLDTDNSINGAIRKIRSVLKDDAEEPRFIQTVTGKSFPRLHPRVISAGGVAGHDLNLGGPVDCHHLQDPEHLLHSRANHPG